ncbi:MAG: ABC transporter ATP-binding protein, partial [Christensenellaceae bacterium]|nr:ABC transporter ATP-binding protein [Christensenellaceae bacterium]
RITVCGYDIQKDKEKAVANAGAIIETPDLYLNFSAYFNLTMFANLLPIEFLKTAEWYTEPDTSIPEKIKDLVAKRVNDVLHLVGLFDRRDDLVRKYSLGMKQRLGIAQALLNRPKLLILDEPANGLDPEGIRNTRDLLKTLAENGMGILISSHILSEMQLMCSRVLIIDKGKLVADKSITDLETGDGARVVFETDNDERAIEILAESGITGAILPNGGIAATGSISDITKAVIMGGLNLKHIKQESVGIEDMFFKNTTGGKD